MTIYWRDTDKVLHSLDVIPSDESSRDMGVMEGHLLTLIFDLWEYVDIPVGAWCDFDGYRYELLKPTRFAKNGNRKWAYNLTMSAPEGNLARWKVRNPADGSLEFPYTATPLQHIALLVEVLNAHRTEDSALWRVGVCVEASEKLMNYNHTYLNDGLAELASIFETEYEVTSETDGDTDYNTLHLHKVEHFKNDPIPLAFGREGGFLPGIKRENSDKPAIERLYIQGTEENISSARYNPLGSEVGPRRLLLPLNQVLGYDGEFYSDEVDYNVINGRVFQSSADGQSITLRGSENTIGDEDSLDCTDIIPAKELIVEGVETERATNSEGKEYDEYNLILGISKGEDYRAYQVDGEIAYVVFQSGRLAGREFDIHTTTDGTLDIERVSENGVFVGWRFKLVGEEQDGYLMPSELWSPNVGDKVKIFGIQLPQDAICNDETLSGASWDMFREGIRVMWERIAKATYYDGEISTSWVARNWATVGAKVRAGSYVRFTDPAFEQEGALIRIASVRTYLNNSHAPQITLSNEIVGRSLRTSLEQIKGEEVTVENAKKVAKDFTKRRFRDAKESQAMLEKALLGEFTETLSPIAINTMQAIVGSTALQYTFVKSLTDMTQAAFIPTIANETIELPNAYIKHETLGIEEVKPERDYSEYMRWWIEGSVLAFEDSERAYYLYIRAPYDSQIANFVLSPEAISIDAEEGYYHLLLATIGKQVDGSRSYQAWNGFTEVTPGAIRANRFVSTDGLQYIDFENNEFRVGSSSAWIEYKNGRLEVSGALVGDAILGREMRVLDAEGQVVAGLSGIENQPLIYGAMQTKLWYHWASTADANVIFYTLAAPHSLVPGSTGIRLFDEPDERLELSSTAQYIADGYIGYGSVTLRYTGDVTVNNNSISNARYQLLSSGVQMIGTPNGRRIEIQPNEDTANIIVFDEGGVARATISDTSYSSLDELTPGTTDIEIPTFGGASLIVGEYASNEFGITFTSLREGALHIPQLTITHSFNTEGYTDTQKSVETQLWCYLDGKPVRFIERFDNLDAKGVTTQTVTTSAFSLNVTKGNHTLTFRLMRNYLHSPSSAIVSTCAVSATAMAEVVYEAYVASLFTNGFAIVKSSNEMFATINTATGMMIRAQINDFGIEVSDEGLRARIGGIWYNLDVSGNNITVNKIN